MSSVIVAHQVLCLYHIKKCWSLLALVFGSGVVLSPTKTNYLASFKSTDTVNIYAELMDLLNLWYPQSQLSGHMSTLSSDRYKYFHAMIIFSSASCSCPDTITAVWEIIAWVCLSDKFGWIWTSRPSICSSNLPRIVLVKSAVGPSSFLVMVIFSCDD